MLNKEPLEDRLMDWAVGNWEQSDEYGSYCQFCGARSQLDLNDVKFKLHHEDDCMYLEVKRRLDIQSGVIEP
jgi:hypothetical protein